MQLTAEQKKSLLEASKPLIKWINENCHPHCEAAVDHTSVEIKEGIAIQCTMEFVKG